MQPLRQWVPTPTRARSEATTQTVRGPASDRPDTLHSNPLRRDLIAAKDLAFCAEFAVHGGQARSPDGFRGEPELVRMHRAGLLDLERDPAPPYNVVCVSLSAAARGVLSGNEPVALEHQQTQRETPAPITTDQAHRRNGFEVARAMVGAAVKAEFAAWITQESLGGPGALEQRVMARINELSAPFPT
jgi:hypothetical protein